MKASKRAAIARKAWLGWRAVMLKYLEEIEGEDAEGRRFDVADHISFCRWQMRTAAEFRKYGTHGVHVQ